MASKTENYAFTVAGRATLNLRNSAGEVRIVGDEGNQVAIRVTRRHSGVDARFGRRLDEDDLDAVRVNVRQNGATITVETEHVRRPHNITVDIEVTLPHECQLDIDVAAGRAEVRDTTGPTHLKVGAGSLHLARLEAQATSRIEVATGQLSGSVALAAGASLDISLAVGEVVLDLPSTTSAEVEARTQVGHMTIDGLPLTVSHSGFVASSAEGRLGDGNGHLRVKVTTGAITLRGR